MEHISGLTAPIFDGGTLRAEKRRRWMPGTQAPPAMSRQCSKRLRKWRLLEALDHDAQQLDSQAQAQQAAQSSLDLARASYSEGNAGVLLVLDAERSTSRQRLGYCQGGGAAHVDTVQLFLHWADEPERACGRSRRGRPDGP